MPVATLDIKIPQMGEGLTEVRLLQFLKKPGDTVNRDDLIYMMETDKATLEVESPESGTLTEWLAAEGDVLPIGTVVARIRTSAEDPSVTSPLTGSPEDPGVEPQATTAERIIPPRTRAYARELGLSDNMLASIPSATSKLMPSDLDAYKAGLGNAVPKFNRASVAGAVQYRERPLSDRQRKLNFHMKRSVQTVIPGTVSRPVEWSEIRNYVGQWREHPSSGRPTEFQTFAYCVVQAIRTCPKFQCSLVREDTIREYNHLHLGVAVALLGGELTTAVVADADLLPFAQFVASLQDRIRSARSGDDQADATVQILLTYLGAYGIRDAVPVLVAPAAAVMFIGEAYTQSDQLFANVSLTFDHRLINGVEAAEMLNAVVLQVQQLGAAHPPLD
jgi:pyruvate/2-oxoglutarate dehydrogenase complex dihydrolipoamide acyltransferase (E2) component